jgi:hypothetical protein
MNQQSVKTEMQKNPFHSTNEDFSMNNFTMLTNNDEMPAGSANSYFTDFTGSREVGIDVGPILSSDNPFYQPKSEFQVKSNEKLAAHTETKIADSDISDVKNDDDLDFSYFDTYKQTNEVKKENPRILVSAEKKEPDALLTESKKDNTTDEKSPNDDQDDEAIEVEKNENDEDKEINDIFSRDIEESLPELFGSYKSSLNLNKDVDKGYLKSKSDFNSSEKMNAPERDAEEENVNEKPWPPSSQTTFYSSLSSTASSSSSQSYAIKKSDKKSKKKKNNRKRSYSLQQAQEAVDNRHMQRDQEAPRDESNLPKSKSQGNVKETGAPFMNGMADYAKPRVCVLTRDPLYEGVGIQLCETKNHMIKLIETGSPAESCGLKCGDKILFINKKNVENASYHEVLELLNREVNSSASTTIHLVVMNVIEYNLLKEENNSGRKKLEIFWIYIVLAKNFNVSYSIKQNLLQNFNTNICPKKKMTVNWATKKKNRPRLAKRIMKILMTTFLNSQIMTKRPA